MGKKAKKAIKTGRKTKYKPEYCEQVYKLCLLSAIDKDIADFFGIAESTLTNWKKVHPEFMVSIKKGKIKADAEVAEKLFHRAKGYEHPEDKIFCNANGEVTTVPTTKHYPPDTAAAFIWLKNRAGWKDKSVTELKVAKETATLLGLIDGGTKGKLPHSQEVKNARQ